MDLRLAVKWKWNMPRVKIRWPTVADLGYQLVDVVFNPSGFLSDCIQCVLADTNMGGEFLVRPPLLGLAIVNELLWAAATGHLIITRAYLGSRF
jgi:NAD-specific glutamate dehydrogenase